MHGTSMSTFIEMKRCNLSPKKVNLEWKFAGVAYTKWIKETKFTSLQCRGLQCSWLHE